ncbi:hypothetical protein [Candidatus Accumulibacter meliphilus]|uniref:hypothetical protein n=1 Tax=Candidatus Accumulibacter meliphilus TaxID=2211374 RepID=UPI003DA7EBD7
MSFSGLPEGARYDADSRHLVWTPGAGQIGDFTVSATVRDGQARNGTASTVFTLRVVAEAAANAPTILVSTTPSTPALPGQTILASVRADAWSGIAQLAVAVRGAAIGPLVGPESGAAGSGPKAAPKSGTTLPWIAPAASGSAPASPD